MSSNVLYRSWAGLPAEGIGANRPILVTGPHRSGTTWVGRMVCSHPGLAYLSEPFNVRIPPSPVRHFFHYVTPAETQAFHAYLAPLLTFHDAALYQIRDAGAWPIPPSISKRASCSRCARHNNSTQPQLHRKRR